MKTLRFLAKLTGFATGSTLIVLAFVFAFSGAGPAALSAAPPPAVEPTPEPVTSPSRSPAGTPPAPAPGAEPVDSPHAGPIVTAPINDPAPARRGDRDPRILDLESRLKDLGYDPGKADGRYDQYTELAVVAFQKVNGLTVDGTAGPPVLDALAHPALPVILRPDGAPSRVEVDLTTQLLTVYQEGRLVLVSHVSTGSGERFCANGRCRRAVTPAGDFVFGWRVGGWRTSDLGRLYNPVYFTKDGIAVHGATSVPLHPASHGCVRIPMHTAGLFPNLVARGTPIHVVAS